MKELTYDNFVGYLRSALHYLYDPVQLRHCPLIELLRLTAEFDRAAALQRILSEAIRSLKPAADESPQARSWRIYDTLNFLYIRQLDRDTVATQLGISERQLRREQRVALEVLARSLWPKIDQAALDNPPPIAESDQQMALEPNRALSEELGWLKSPTTEQRIPLGEVMQTVQNLAQPLAQQWQAPLQIDVPSDLLEIAVTPLVLRSILLTILSVAIPRAGRKPVLISVQRHDRQIELAVRCHDPGATSTPFSDVDAASLQTVKNLAEFYNACFIFPNQAGASFTATLILSLPESIPVLVIDDNADWIELLQRYTAASPYQVIGARQPEQAQQLAEKTQPAVIILDVMMHNVDGWQVLSELRHASATAHLPIVVCTILPVEGLALSLGANAFLQKPATQQQFLKILDAQSIPAE